MDLLVASVRRVRVRLFMQQWIHALLVSVTCSVSAACLWLFCTRLLPTLGDPIRIGTWLVILGAAIATLRAWQRRPSLIDAALEADNRLGLRERFTSSLELAGVEGPMIAELHADARAHVSALDIPRDFPIVLSNRSRWAYVPIVLFGLAYVFLPEFDLFGVEARRAEARVKSEKVRMRIERLEEESAKLAEAALPEEGPLAEAAELMDRVSDQLERGVITERQALAKLTDLRDVMKQKYDQLSEARPVPKLATDTSKFGLASDLASALQKGRFGDALKKAKELQKKLEQGELTEQEMQELSEAMKKLAELLGAQNAALAEALAEAGACLASGDCNRAALAMTDAELSLEELQSLLEQLDALAKAGQCLSGACRGRGGISPWAPGESDKFGNGMGGPGMGRGGGVGELPDVDGKFDPSLLPGPMSEGKMLLSIEQKAAPDMKASSKIEYLQGAFVAASQAAEQAIQQEEIPRASKEYVRQYFGTLEPQAGIVQDSIQKTP